MGGAANPTAITNAVNSTYADQSGFIEGPGIALQTVTNNAGATAAQTAAAIANVNGALTGAASIQSAASPLRVEVHAVDLRGVDVIERGVAAFAGAPHGGLLVPPAALATMICMGFAGMICASAGGVPCARAGTGSSVFAVNSRKHTGGSVRSVFMG